MVERVTLKPYDRYGVATFVVQGDAVHIGHFGGSWDDEGEKLVSVSEQMAQTFANLERALKEIRCGLQDLVKVTVILKDIRDFQEMHEAWKKLFPKNAPVRTTLTSEFVENHCRVQIEGLACRPAPSVQGRGVKAGPARGRS